jgi:large subunit ribosomal protein L4
MASPKAPVLDGAGKTSKQVSLEAAIFGAEVKPHLVHETVRSELNAARSGTHHVKTRGMVAGGRSKPWRQKGTGRARAGTIRAPQFTGGGAAFEPRTNFTTKVNRKERRSAFRSALTAHASGGSLALLDGAAFERPSTKQAASLLGAWGKPAPVVIVATEEEENLAKSFRNLERVVVTTPGELEVTGLVWARSLLVSEAALEAVQRRAT